MSDKGMRLAVFSPNWLGDAVMALPAILGVRRQHPGAALVAVARASVSSLFEAVPGIDEVVTIDPARPIESVRQAALDVAILFPNSFGSAWIARKAGIAERWGYAADFRRPLLTRAVRRRRGGHHADYYRRLVEGLGIEAAPVGSVRLEVPEAARRSADHLLASRGWEPGRRLVGVAPGAAYGSAKRWPAAGFAGVVAHLSERAGVTPVLVGGAADAAAAAEIERALGPAASRQAPPDEGRAASARAPGWINLVGHTGLLELLAIAGRCEAFVSNDSGAMHAAAAMGTRVTAVFGATDERATSPMAFGGAAGRAIGHRVIAAQAWCRPCLLRECPIDHRCMRRIGAAEVIAAVEGQMDTP